MSEAETPQATISLADLLPVGMLAHSGTVGQAMSSIANSKVGQPGWEAFHYERISESEFEITGGLVIMAGGTKKWPGPHDSLVISEAEILLQMQSTNVASEVVAPVITAAIITPNANPRNVDYLNVVFALPQDEASRQRVLQAFHLQANFFGATVQACSLPEKKT
jgi:hypothetical protein